MTVTSTSRGHEVYWDEENGFWRFSDNDEPDNENRSCKNCGEPPTIQGYDACLGELPGVIHACCGHGNEKERYVVYGDWYKNTLDYSMRLLFENFKILLKAICNGR